MKKTKKAPTQEKPRTILKQANYNLSQLEEDWYFGQKYPYNLKYCVETDSDYYTNCSNYGCDEEGICRCGRIENAVVTSVDIPLIIKYLALPKKDKYWYPNVDDIKMTPTNIIEMYCLDRLLRLHKVYDPYSWEIAVENDYYGQEIGAVYFNDEVRNNLMKSIQGVMKFKTNAEKIKKVLEYEYGFILPKLMPMERATIEDIKIDSIILSNEDYSRKIDKEAQGLYKEYDFPRAVCWPEPKGKFHLIDGYHRICGARAKGDTEIKAIIMDY